MLSDLFFLSTMYTGSCMKAKQVKHAVLKLFLKEFSIILHPVYTLAKHFYILLSHANTYVSLF